MKKKTIKFTALAAASGITLLACGCGGNGNQTNPTNRTTNVYSSLVDYSVHSDTRVSDIMVWRPPTDLSDEQWQWLKESGVNTIMTDSGIGGQRGAQFGSDSQKAYIEQCRKFGLSAMGYTNGNYNKNVKDYGDTGSHPRFFRKIFGQKVFRMYAFGLLRRRTFRYDRLQGVP